MHSFLIIVHVVSMMASLGLMSSALLFGLFGSKQAARLSTYGMYATVSGGISGALLLIDAPLNIQCAMLTAYLIAMGAIYKSGFAMGDAGQARFIRHRAIQKR